jgi:hypothetical protein
MIRVQFETMAADFKALQQFAVATAKKSAPSSWRLIAILFCAGLSFGLMGFSVHTPTVVFATGTFAAIWLYIRWQYASVIVPSERGSVLGPRQTSVDETGVREQSANHTFVTAWDGVLGVEETPTHVFVMVDRLAGYIVPKRAFDNAAQLGEFLTFVRTRVVGSRGQIPTGPGTS